MRHPISPSEWTIADAALGYMNLGPDPWDEFRPLVVPESAQDRVAAFEALSAAYEEEGER